MREADIHPADLAYRRRSLLIIAAIVVLALFGLWQLDGWLSGLATQLAQDGDPQRTRRWLRGLLVALALLPVVPLSLLARSLRRLAAAAQAERRFPPRDWRTLRDVRVLRGVVAQRWIVRVRRMAAAASVLAILCAVLAMAMLWYYR
ncbi:hypothetical protein ASE35_05090 [Lysobacter sp. Root916]|uniref:hypothetical protein n=1 Tax=Lysobacter sp. Root916 TaxID=1736606 RepID=UPI000709F8CD|nr:hypothetical protein [Lysobacter sp. Root916]KRD39709.1 hypothetical protein ASE35_05090 [Lysobacter sp. Root916]